MPRQNTSPAEFPQAVLQQIAQLGQNIAIARKRRAESQAQWARRLGVSQPTMARIERGDPAVSMASYAMCLWLINQAQGLAELISPLNDHAALEKEVAKVRARRQPQPLAGAAARRQTLAPVPAPTARSQSTTARGLQSLLAGAGGAPGTPKQANAVTAKPGKQKNG